jgi:glycosyltransferase involved in cell wall biosynthesis
VTTVSSQSSQQIWIHALGAKVGGGVTYLRAVLPEIASALEGRGVRVVVLAPGPIEGVDLPPFIEVRPHPLAARNAFSRLAFDQVLLPLRLARARGAVLYCSGSFAPIVKTVPTVALVRNAIYFDDAFLGLTPPRMRRSLRIRGRLILRAARGCRAVVYPTWAMRALVEARDPALASAGVVNHYGVGDAFARARGSAADSAAPGGARTTFLYVLNYTLQKNVGFLLEALALARAEGLPVRVVLTSHLTDGPPTCEARDHELIERHQLVESGYLELVGPKYGEELLALYRAVDACVFPSVCESFGHPLVEAMAIGKPLICADRPYARELCGEHALYVDPERPETLVDLWRRWSERRAAWVPAPAEDVAERFSWRGHVDRLLALLVENAAESLPRGVPRTAKESL